MASGDETRTWADDPAVAQWFSHDDEPAPAPQQPAADPAHSEFDDAAITGPVARVAPPPGSGYAPPIEATAPKTVPKPRRPSLDFRKRSTRAVVIVGGLGLLLVAVVVAVPSSLFGDADSSAAPPVLASNSAAAPAPAADADCPTRTDGPVVTGRDAGGAESGPAAIKAFDYGYYVTRSGAAARAVVTPNAKVGTVEQIDAGIAGVEANTLHCLKITDQGAGLYGVELTEIPPRGAAPVVVHQLVQTTVADGRTWITSIEKDPNYQ